MSYQEAFKNLNIPTDQKVVFTNGCFDILHAGHVAYLNEAKAQGDYLIVGLNSDASVRRLKGDDRPVIGEHQRKEMLMLTNYVDEVIVFEEDTPLDLIKELKPSVLVKGNDYENSTIVGSEFVINSGGDVVRFPIQDSYSSSQIISVMKD